MALGTGLNRSHTRDGRSVVRAVKPRGLGQIEDD